MLQLGSVAGIPSVKRPGIRLGAAGTVLQERPHDKDFTQRRRLILRESWPDSMQEHMPRVPASVVKDFCTFNAGDSDSIPDQGTMILCRVARTENKKKEEKGEDMG